MLEALSFSEISILELAFSIFFAAISLIIVAYIYGMKKGEKFAFGFGLILVYNLMSTADLFFAQSLEREILFNIGGRIILIAGMLFLIFAFKSFLPSSGSSKK